MTTPRFKSREEYERWKAEQARGGTPESPPASGALASCSVCGGQVAKTAKSCPHCGQEWPAGIPTSKALSGAGTSLMKAGCGVIVLFAVLVVVVSIFMSGGREEAPPLETATAPAQEPIRAEVLMRAYEDNELAADQRYKGRTLDVVGTVESIGREIVGRPYVVLSAGEAAMFVGVQCVASLRDAAKEEAKMARLRQGQRVVVRGKADGKLLNVLLSDCVIRG